jgi:DNA-binding transcriptional ArsR family regulator
LSKPSVLNNPPPDALLLACKASADALRLDILKVLRAESFGVLELCKIFGMPQPGMSHHLKILAKAGLLATRREGNSIFYHRNLDDSMPKEFCLALFNTLDSSPIGKAIQLKVKQIQEDRTKIAADFFTKHADKFKKNQDLIAEFSHYKNSLEECLDQISVPKTAQVIELGPGESPFLSMLTERFDHVFAIDNAALMLEKAKVALVKENQKKATFLFGDIETATTNLLSSVFVKAHTDLIVLNMVLHHLASPSVFFKTASQQLADSGRLLIVDLCQHHQDWARDICGDMWLGFNPADIDIWAQDAGLTIGRSTYLGLKNGFQVQVRLFTKMSSNKLHTMNKLTLNKPSQSKHH